MTSTTPKEDERVRDYMLRMPTIDPFTNEWLEVELASKFPMIRRSDFGISVYTAISLCARMFQRDDYFLVNDLIMFTHAEDSVLFSLSVVPDDY